MNPRKPAVADTSKGAVGKRLQDSAAARRAFDAARARVEQQNAALKQRAAQIKREQLQAEGKPADGGDASANVRQKILETIKRGIADNSDRTDLQDGERRMLEHMYALRPRLSRQHLPSASAHACTPIMLPASMQPSHTQTTCFAPALAGSYT